MASIIAARSAASSSASRFSRISCAYTAKSCFSTPSTSSSPSSTSPFVNPSVRSSPLANHTSSRHISDWRSPLSHRAVIRSSAMVTERFERKFSSMATKNSYEGILTSLAKPGGGEFGKYFSLPALNDPRIEKLPYSIRILLESAIRNCDEFQVTAKDVEKIIDWENTSPKLVEIPFKPSRVLLQDFTGVPAVVDLACMRDAMNKLGGDSNKINPLVPVDLVIDHSVQVDVARSENAVQANMELEFQRNKERFGFLKWGSTAFDNMLVVPPGSGIVHQVNLEYLARVVFNRDGLLYPDSVVGTDSHTTMVDGLGVAGWGVGGIEAEAVMLGQPMSMVLPGVVGFKLSGKLKNGVTATDLVLTVTQILRKHGVVGKFVEFYGEGMAELSLADRATIANMSPEYGATMGFFPVDNVTLQYLKLTGRSDATVSMIESYLRANNMFVDYSEPQTEKVYSSYLQLNLEDVDPCISGPKRPHDRVPLKEMKTDWHSCLDSKVGFKGFDIPKESQAKIAEFSFKGKPAEIKHGDVVIAAITSCTNTSNPSVMLGAALVAKKACELGLEVKPWIKTSLAPGSGVVTKYLEKSGLQKYLNQLGFNIVGYGCTTCIGNSGDLNEAVSSAISENDIVAAAVLSGNRNFEGRVHPLTRANYLASPPLVVAYALAGTVDIDFEKQPIGIGKDGKEVFFSDIWPSNEEIADVVQSSVLPSFFKSTYESITKGNPMWNELSVPSSSLYSWDPTSTYIHEPPYFKNMTMTPPGPHGVKSAYCLLNFGDSVTTDHISPAGSIHKDSPAAKFLMERNVERKDFNSYGSRRGNDEVMARGTFGNIRIVNKLLKGETGPKTIHVPSGEKLSVFDAAAKYKNEGQDTIILAGAPMMSCFLLTTTKINLALLPNRRPGFSNAITRVSIRSPPPGFDYKTETAVDSVVALERNRDLADLKDLVEEGTLVVVDKRRFGPVPSWRTEFVEPEEIWLFGTSHVSEKSAVDVDRVVRAVMPERVVVELCRSRAGIMYYASSDDVKSPVLKSNMFSLSGSNFFDSIVRSINLGGQSALALRLLLAAFSSKISSGSNRPFGDEFRAARKVSEIIGAQIVLGDRPIEITLERSWNSLNWNDKLRFISSLFRGIISDSSVLRQGSLKREVSDGTSPYQLYEKLSISYPSLLQALVHERDVYLAWSLKRSKAVNCSKRVVGVIGKGHLNGVVHALISDQGNLRFRDVAGKNSSDGNSNKWIATLLNGLVRDTIIGIALWVLFVLFQNNN